MAASKSHVPAIVKCALFFTISMGLGLGLVAMGLGLGLECLRLGLGLECVGLGLVLGLEALSLESKSE